MRRFLFLVVVIAIFLAALYDWNHRRREARRAEQFTPAEPVKLDEQDVHLLTALDQEYTKLVDAVVPSVVSITTARKVHVQENPYLVDPFEQFFGFKRRGVPRDLVQNALGSGVIVSKEGHIITNYHVIANVDEVKVQLKDGRTLPAQIVGSDEQSDIAVLKIDAQNITPLPFGNSDQVKVGQIVFAVGNPFGLQESVTRGTISAKRGRAMEDSGEDFFQTDTTINPGNSGGPLINVRGEIIGINNAIRSESGSWQGIGFAIPSNVARRTLEAIIKEGHVVHGYLGVAIQELSPELAEQFGVKDTTGALVNHVLPGSPAENAGIKTGDIITKFNGSAIRDIQDLRNRVADTPVNTKVQLGIIRAGQEMTVTADILEQPNDFQTSQQPAAPAAPTQPQPTQPAQPAAENNLSGITVAEIPDDHRADLPDNVKGVMVTDVDPDSAAAGSSDPLRAGDVIEEIDRQPVASVAEFERLAEQLKPGARQTLLFICRGKTRSFVVLGPR